MKETFSSALIRFIYQMNILDRQLKLTLFIFDCSYNILGGWDLFYSFAISNISKVLNHEKSCDTHLVSAKLPKCMYSQYTCRFGEFAILASSM